jgi:SOS-response transcriptional repressor LexA
MKSAEKTQILAQRLYDCRLAQGWSQRQAADAMDVALRSVQSWEAGQALPHPAKIRKIAATFGRPIAWFFGDDTGVPTGNAAGVLPVRVALPVRVPVVSWAAAGTGGSYYDLAHQIDEWLNTDCKDPNAYALILEGDSMEPEFKAGDRVIFMPNDQPRNGDVVVARLEDTGDVFFKLYHAYGRAGEMVRLTSYNAAYPPLEFHRDQFRFIHPMHSLIRRRR